MPDLMRSRFFNAVRYDSGTHSILKTSTDQDKLRDEINWYLQLPSEYQHLVPEVLEHGLQEEPFLRLAYVGLPTLADLWVHKRLSPLQWNQVWEQLDELLLLFRSHSAIVTAEDMEDMYIHKTHQRLQAFLEGCSWAQQVYAAGSFRLNGRLLSCPIRLLEEGRPDLRRLCTSPQPALLHGDLCFSNVLYAPSTRKMLLIDPRGRFGQAGISGDQRYDLAKLRHSLSGYDYLVRGMYRLITASYELHLDIPHQQLREQLRREWDSRHAHILESIRCIECLLYLSMLPLHQEDSKRQLALYATGTALLHDVLMHR